MSRSENYWGRRFRCPIVLFSVLFTLLRGEPARSTVFHIFPPLWPTAGLDNYMESWYDVLGAYMGADMQKVRKFKALMDGLPEKGARDDDDEDDEDDDDISPHAVLAQLLAEADKRRTTYDRVGTYVVFTIVWSMLLSPFLIFLNVVRKIIWKYLLKDRLEDHWPKLNEYGVFEVSAYYLSGLLIAQGLRFHYQDSSEWSDSSLSSTCTANASAPVNGTLPAECIDDGVRFAMWHTSILIFCGLLCFYRCWQFSAHSHLGPEPGPLPGGEPGEPLEETQKKMTKALAERRIEAQLEDLASVTAGQGLTALLAITLATEVHSRVLGSSAMIATTIAVIGLVLLIQGRPFIVRYLDVYLQTAACYAIALTLCGILAGRILGPGWTRPFGEGFALCGHVLYLLAVMLLSSSRWKAASDVFRTRQTVMVMSLVAAGGLSFSLKAPGLTGAAFTFMMLWLMMLEGEVNTSSALGSGFKLAATLAVLRYVYLHSDYVVQILDPKNLYV